MDKETLLSKFKPSMGDPNATSQIYENIGVSVRTFDAYVDQILPSITDDASVSDDFIKGHVDFLKAMGGQMRHEFAEFAKNYKPSTPTAKQESAEENSELKALKESLEELKNQLNGQQKQKSIEELRQSVKNKAKELKVHNQALFDDVVNAIEIKDGMDAAALETAVKSAYETKLKAYFGEGAQPYGGSSNRQFEESKNAEKALDDYFAKKAKEGKFPSKKQ